MEYFEALSVSQDREYSVILFNVLELNEQENQARTRAFMLLRQHIPGNAPTESNTLWFLPNVKGYATACDHTIAARQEIWGDSAPDDFMQQEVES